MVSLDSGESLQHALLTCSASISRWLLPAAEFRLQRSGKFFPAPSSSDWKRGGVGVPLRTAGSVKMQSKTHAPFQQEPSGGYRNAHKRDRYSRAGKIEEAQSGTHARGTLGDDDIAHRSREQQISGER